METGTKERRLVLGFVDAKEMGYSGKRGCEAEFTWELKDSPEGARFSMCAAIWKPNHSDICIGGQAIEEVIKYFPNHKQAQRMAEIWRKYHLNDMHAGCEHQRALGWGSNRMADGSYDGHKYEAEGGCLCKPCPVCGYKYGTKWLFEAIPQNIIDEIKSW